MSKFIWQDISIVALKTFDQMENMIWSLITGYMEHKVEKSGCPQYLIFLLTIFFCFCISYDLINASKKWVMLNMSFYKFYMYEKSLWIFIFLITP